MIENTPNNQEISFLAAIFTIFLCIMFGSNAVAIKISLSGLGAFTTAGLRFSMASIVIFLWAITTRQPLKIKSGQAHQLIIISVVFTVQLSLFYLGLSKTNASRGTLLVNLVPFFILFLAHYFIPGDHITKRKLLGILMGFSGVAFVFLEKKGVTADFQTGDLMILIATLVWACSAVYTKRIIDNYEPFHLVLYPMIVSVPLFFLGALFWDDTMVTHLNLKVLGSLFYQSFVTASFGYLAWTILFRKYGATSLYSFVFIMPIAGVFLGGLVLGEPITFKILVALILIVSGILIVHLKPRKPPQVFPLEKGL